MKNMIQLIRCKNVKGEPEQQAYNCFSEKLVGANDTNTDFIAVLKEKNKINVIKMFQQKREYTIELKKSGKI